MSSCFLEAMIFSKTVNCACLKPCIHISKINRYSDMLKFYLRKKKCNLAKEEPLNCLYIPIKKKKKSDIFEVI